MVSTLSTLTLLRPATVGPASGSSLHNKDQQVKMISRSATIQYVTLGLPNVVGHQLRMVCERVQQALQAMFRVAGYTVEGKRWGGKWGHGIFSDQSRKAKARLPTGKGPVQP